MADALKNLYNETVLNELSNSIKQNYIPFNSKQFVLNVFNDDWENKELKQRMRHIAKTLHNFLPNNYNEAIQILKSASTELIGFEYMFFPDFVELYGLDDFNESMLALEHFTKCSSSEFAVRPFIKNHEDKMMAQMQIWADSNNHNVRRLASEGCRPRLPWAMALPQFKENPIPVLTIIEKLMNDDSAYVRKSVANNLNDISKDHPNAVINVAKKWLGVNKNTDKIIKHSCRTLLKQGNLEAMELFGFINPVHIKIKDFKVKKSLSIGEKLLFSFVLKSNNTHLGKIRIEYAIDFMKNNGKQSRKIFQISESNNPFNNKTITKSHSFKIISTRKYYTGVHGICIFINGKKFVSGTFDLKN